MICQNCKKEIDNDSKFCEFCGNKIKIDKGYGKVIDDILNNKQNQAEITLELLNKKMWYRALKVLYFVGIAIGTVIALGIAIDESAPMAFVVLMAITLLSLEIIKRSFYYIYLGKLFVKKRVKSS